MLSPGYALCAKGVEKGELHVFKLMLEYKGPNHTLLKEMVTSSGYLDQLECSNGSFFAPNRVK